MNNPTLPIERLVENNVLIKGKVFDFRIDETSTDGHIILRRHMDFHTKGAVGVLVIRNGKFVLVNQFRYAQKDFILEIPAGKIDDGEEVLTAAFRELREETGYTTKELIPLPTLIPTAAYSNEKVFLYLATDLVKEEQDLDDGEYVEIVELTEEQFDQRILDGEIQDSKTIIAFLSWKAYHKGK